jgi:hypothetical protein
MHCQVTKMLWFASPLGIHVPHQLSLDKWLQQWLTNPNYDDVQLFSLTLWKIWKGRYEVLFNKGTFCPMDIVKSISDFAVEFNDANRKSSGCCPVIIPAPVQAESWEPPSRNVTKINVDAGCFKDGFTCWGLVGRNNEGRPLFAATKRETIKLPVVAAEATSLRWCIQWIKEHHMSNVVIEMDSEIVVQCLLGKSYFDTIDLIIAECLELLFTLVIVSVIAVKRCKNIAAHGLVGIARNVGPKSWWGNVPAPISSIICNELSSIN